MNTAAQAADEWWHTLPPERRAQIHRWVDRPHTHHETPGQIEIPIPTTQKEVT